MAFLLEHWGHQCSELQMGAETSLRDD